ncbi:deaminase [Streptomyces sp. NPDC048518]|uniref:deaminase n=1 Tax=Streptomyces sp. NPDC048518 TaxID=3155029 RepID=UPI0033CB8981
MLVDARGHVVARGRNRSQEAATTAPPGQLAGAAIAHAEVNVLGQLTAERRYEDHRLFTTLEPCLLCSGALLHAHVGTVVYAARFRHDASPSGGERAFDHGARAPARRCAEIPGFTEAETVAVAYRLALPHLSPYGKPYGGPYEGDAGGSGDK